MGILSKLKGKSVKPKEVKPKEEQEDVTLDEYVKEGISALKEFEDKNKLKELLDSEGDEDFSIKMGLVARNFALFKIGAYRKFGSKGLKEVKKIENEFWKRWNEVIEKWLRKS